MKFFYDGNPTDVMKGHIVKLLEYFDEDYDDRIRITLFENITTGRRWASKIRGITTSRPKLSFKNPIIGKVVSIWNDENWQDTTNIEIEEGVITADHVFVKAGEQQKGQQALSQILMNNLNTYVKICDPYLSSDTIKILNVIPSGIDILFLTEKIHDLKKVKTESKKINNKIIIKQSSGLHDRFILTKGNGWTVGHSIKDFGSKDSYLAKMDLHLDAETTFDARWNQSLIV